MSKQEKTRLLVVDDELTETSTAVSRLVGEGIQIEILRREDQRVPTFEEVAERVERFRPQAVLCDIEFSGEPFSIDQVARNGFDLAREIHNRKPDLPIVLFTSYVGDAIRETVEDPDSDFIMHALSKQDAIKDPGNAVREVLDVIRLHGKPTSKDLTLTIGSGDDRVRRHFPNHVRTRAKSPRVRRFYRRILELADRNEPVLIAGDPGVGKELFARALHFSGQRASLRWVAVEAGLTQNKDELRSWIYGRMPGEFTEVSPRASEVWRAAGGTILLNDLFAAPMDCQNMLLPLFESKPLELVVREQGKFVRRKVEPIWRVLATVNPIDKPDSRASLDQWRVRGARKDLFDRVTVLEVPSWEERKEDIAEAVQANFQAEYLRRFPGHTVSLIFQQDEFRTAVEEVIADDPVLLNGRAFQRIGQGLAARLESPSQPLLLRDVLDTIETERGRLGELPSSRDGDASDLGIRPRATRAIAPNATTETPLERFMQEVERIREIVMKASDHVNARSLADALPSESGGLDQRRVKGRPDMFFPAHLWKLSEFDSRLLPRGKQARIAALRAIEEKYPRELYKKWIDLALKRAKPV